jgi:hypothetical protein
MDYDNFLAQKLKEQKQSGFEVGELNKKLFPFQDWIVKRALKAGKYAIFADCGLGKTFMQLEWARQVADHTKGEVLILAPLAVTDQTIDEAKHFNISLDRITITNYEQLDNLDCSKFTGVVLDESSIIKDYSGATKNKIVESFADTPYKLACSATPSPNDPIEIGSQSEFLNQMSGQEMLSMFFINDGMKANKWKLKGHAKKAFYRWMATWSVMLTKPHDIGFEMDGYELPPLNIIDHKVQTEKVDNGELFNDSSVSAITFNAELRRTFDGRMNIAIDIANSSKESFMVLCRHNEEGDHLGKKIAGAVNVQGNDEPQKKKSALLGFAKDQFRVLVTKSKIVKFGMNYQNCHNIIMASLDFSFEELYQVIRREWRFGQTKPVNVHIITTDTMQNVAKAIEEKQAKFKEMQTEMVEAMQSYLGGNKMLSTEFDTKELKNQYFQIKQGDSIELIKGLETDSIDLSIFSPPFSSLYVYSDNARDLSNCKNHDEFFTHFEFLVGELLRVTKPGRLCALHLTQLTTLMGKDGFYSIVDFRGDVIRLFQSKGWNFHAETTVWKDPQLAAVRTKCVQLLHGQTKRDSCVSRPGLADYVLAFRKPGENAIPVNHDGNGVPFHLWCEYASPVWMDINASDTLQYMSGKGEDDVRHITPTQLEIWKRAITLWSNPGEIVFTPFMGIGSEVYQSILLKRKAIGFELKESYFDQAKSNLKIAMEELSQIELFDGSEQ